MTSPVLTRHAIADAVVQVVRTELRITGVRAINDTTTLADLGADSLDLVEIAIGLDSHFGRPVGDLRDEQTIADVVAQIEGRLS